MRTRSETLVGLALAVGLPLSVLGPSSNDELADRVTELEAKLTEQTTALAEATARIDELEAFQKGVVEGTQALQKAVEGSRRDGFEWAGPNPRSKTELLDGLSSFGRRVRGEPEPESEPAKEPKEAKGGRSREKDGR